MKVIIADYDEEAIRLFEEQCKQFSYVELSGKFNDSAETLKYVSRHRVEAAFINIELNGMDGLQLGEKLRELNPKIVLVFFIEHTEYILEALRIKADGYMIRPYTMEDLMKEYNFIKPVLFSIVLGHKGEAPATPKALFNMISMIPKEAVWGITHANRRDFGIIAAALGMGAKTVRIGFEDSNYIDNINQVDTNLPLVEKTVRLIKSMDKDIMTPDEARRYFKIKG